MVKDALAQKYVEAKREGWAKYIRKGPGQEADERAMLNGCKIDLIASQRWVNIFERGLAKPDGTKFELMEWQRNEVVVPLFGWIRPNGNRRYRKGCIWTAKKNGKTTTIAGIVNGFLYESPPNSHLYATAYSREQARTLFDQTAAITRESRLSKFFDIRESQYLIKYPKKHSYFKTVAGEMGAHGLDGLIAQLAIIDEIHEHKTRAVFDRFDYSIAASPNGMVLSISTVGVEDRSLIWWEQYDYSKRILSGEMHDDSFFVYLAQADPECITNEELRRDPEQWKKANPSLGITISLDDFRDSLQAAENSPSKMNNFLRRRLNIPTAQLAKCINMTAWQECELRDMPDLSGRRCFAGLDLASTEDLTAWVLYFPPVDDEPGYLLSRFWCPEEKMRQREMEQMVHYVNWRKLGWLTITPGKVVSYKQILADISEDLEQYNVEQVGYDKWNAEMFVQELEQSVDCVAISQSLQGMTIGTKAFLTAIEKAQLRHDGNEVMTWCCGNAAADRRSGEEYVKFSKKDSADKIDGAVAAAMAFHLSEMAEPETESIYSEPGGLFL